ncbi:S-layer homology domain-containing protein [Paenibacillus sp. IB182496]|uniref:S-layer homology domain-containing protein n=1 Tax=Paenibacillus sabuli TaxID=2772509 RepID=A0A927BUY3_9BACL|nr:S-layer homology domain-containing protein [Paenibacillus sabuli]MBD2846366.1 S-layer homology domain-containing protein [Paenibacillus sabuli]
MTPRPGGGSPGIYVPIPTEPEPEDAEVDLAVELSATQRGYMEQSQITLELPPFVTVVEVDGGVRLQDSVVWELGAFEPGAAGTRTIVLQLGELEQAELEALLTATITASNPLIELQDDTSALQLMFYSNRYGELVHHRYIMGYPDGEFKPVRAVTRAEIAAIFARILDLDYDPSQPSPYADVAEGRWYTPGIVLASEAGLFDGYGDGRFRPDQPITRAELAAVIARYMGLTDRAPVVTDFADLQGHWAANLIEEIHRTGIAQGYLDGSFKPNAQLTREEAVTMINRLLYRGPLTATDASFPDVSSDRWSFGQVEESTKSHAAIRLPDGSEEQVRVIEEELDY